MIQILSKKLVPPHPKAPEFPIFKMSSIPKDAKRDVLLGVRYVQMVFSRGSTGKSKSLKRSRSQLEGWRPLVPILAILHVSSDTCPFDSLITNHRGCQFHNSGSMYDRDCVVTVPPIVQCSQVSRTLAWAHCCSSLQEEASGQTQIVSLKRNEHETTFILGICRKKKSKANDVL